MLLIPAPQASAGMGVHLLCLLFVVWHVCGLDLVCGVVKHHC